MLRSAACPEEPPQAASRRGARLEARTVAGELCYRHVNEFSDSLLRRGDE